MKLFQIVGLLALCPLLRAEKISQEDLLGTWQSEVRVGGRARGEQEVSIITRNRDGTYKTRIYIVDHDLRVYYQLDKWTGTWVLKKGLYVEVESPDFSLPAKTCERDRETLVFTHWIGRGMRRELVKVVDTPSKDGRLTYSGTYRDVKSETGWEKARKAGAKPSRNEKSEQDGAGQPATAPESKPEGNQKPKPESEGRSK